MNVRASAKRVAAARMMVEGLIADNTVGAVLRRYTGSKQILIDAVGRTLQITVIGADAIWDAYQAEIEEEGLFLGLMDRKPHADLRKKVIQRLTKRATLALTEAFDLNFRLGEVNVAAFERDHRLVFEAEFKPEDIDRILLTF